MESLDSTHITLPREKRYGKGGARKRVIGGLMGGRNQDLETNEQLENCMAEIKKWGGKRVRAGREYKGYEKFQDARLEPELKEWLRSEKGNYTSWNIFFRELKNRYENTTR